MGQANAMCRWPNHVEAVLLKGWRRSWS